MDYDSFVTRLRITRSYLANHPTHGSWEEAGVVEQAADAIVALRSDLAAAQEEAQYRGFLVRDLLPYQERAVKAETDLAAARALGRVWV